MFATLSNAKLPILKEIGKGDKKASFFNGHYDVKIETQTVVIYKDEKAAKFATADEE